MKTLSVNWTRGSCQSSHAQSKLTQPSAGKLIALAPLDEPMSSQRVLAREALVALEAVEGFDVQVDLAMALEVVVPVLRWGKNGSVSVDLEHPSQQEKWMTHKILRAKIALEGSVGVLSYRIASRLGRRRQVLLWAGRDPDLRLRQDPDGSSRPPALRSRRRRTSMSVGRCRALRAAGRTLRAPSG